MKRGEKESCTVVPHIARLIRSGLTLAMWKHRWTDQENPFQMGRKLTVQRCFPMAGSHFRALPSLTEGAKMLRTDISGLPAAILELPNSWSAGRKVKVSKRNAYRSSLCEFCPLGPLLCDCSCDWKKPLAMRIRRSTVRSLSEAPLYNGTC